MKFTLEIESGNEALVEDPTREVARILRETADRVVIGAAGVDSGRVRDYNGNTVGNWSLELDAEDDDA